MRLMQRLDVVIQKEPSIEDFRLTEKRKALADWWSHEEVDFYFVFLFVSFYKCIFRTCHCYMAYMNMV